MARTETPESVVAAMCRTIAAVSPGGFDAKEHPEHEAIAKALLSGPLYPLTAETVADILNGKIVLRRVA